MENRSGGVRGDTDPTSTLAERLVTVTRLLRGNAENVEEIFGYAGMASEYRSGLVAARAAAEHFINRQNEAGNASRELARMELARIVVESTHAIVFSMRHSFKYDAIVRAAVDDLTRLVETIERER